MAEHADQAELNRIKRLKTARACDQCRRVRSRCDIANPAAASPDESICERCRRLGLECTFILPIGETRGKRIPARASNPDHTSPSSATTEGSPASIAEAFSDPVERFRTFITTHLPIIAPKDLTHDSSILLHCCARLLATLCLESSPDGTTEQLKASLDAYMLSKTPFKTPTVQNVQALLLLALLVDDPGYGLKFMTAVRMACSLGWNLQTNDAQPDTESPDTHIQYLWWTLVSEDIWLYLYSGLPLVINYRDFNVPRPPAPPLFASLVSLSEVLRFKIRPSSLSERTPAATPYAALLEWQTRHLPAESAPSPAVGEKVLSADAVVRLCHGVVVAVFVLDHDGGVLPQRAEQHLQGALQCCLEFAGVVGRVRLLGRLGRICAVGLMRLARLRGLDVVEGVVAYREVVGAEVLRRLVGVEQDESVGWRAVWRVGDEGF